MRRPQGDVNPATRRYVAAIVAAAIVAVSGLALLVGVPFARPGGFVLLLFVAILAERTEVEFRTDRTTAGFSLIEVAVTAGLLLAPPVHVVVAVVVAMLVSHPSFLRTPIKVAYNLGYVALGTAMAGFVVTSFPAIGPLVGGRSVLGVVLGMVAYGLTSLLAFSGLLARLQGQHAASTMRRQLLMHSAATLGTTSVGIVLAALWVMQPALVPFVVAPAAAVHLAMRSSLRAAELLAAQRAEHDRLVRVVDGASDGILLIDAEGRIQVWNPAMARLTGKPDRQVVDRHAADVLTDDVRSDAPPVRGRWTVEQAREHVPFLELDAALTDGEGQRREVRESHTFTFDDRGRCTGAVVVIRDVSRQRELERLRSDFVARVSHELRTPLTPIRGFASVLLRRGEQLDEDQRAEALTRIVDRADHLHGLVEDLLLVTRLDQEDVDELVHAGPTDLARLVRTSVEECIAATGRTITVSGTDDLPHAHADPDRAKQVLDAVLDNAARYSEPDTPIEVEADRQGDDVRVRIVDHGPGIPSSQRQAVFERFNRLEDPMTMQTSGVGVGLFLGRRLAEAMHGTLEVLDTPPGDGATLELRLPVARPGPERRTPATDDVVTSLRDGRFVPPRHRDG
jgi:PAS domain S-box-containing protein